MPEQITDQNKKFPLELKWPIEDDLPFLYTNHFSISDTGHEIIIVFGNFLPTGFHRRSNEEIEAYLSQAMVKPIAKIVMSHSGFKAFMGLLESKRADFLDPTEEESSND